MKKLLVASLASVLTISFAPAAVLAQECNISNTGPGSVNECVDENEVECDVTNDNNVDIDNDNDQDAGSGDAGDNSNTTGGDTNSGDASNDNGTDVDVDIDNDGCVPENETTPPTGGQGGGTPETTPAVQGASTELPETGTSMVAVGAATAFVLGTASAIATKKLLNDEQ